MEFLKQSPKPLMMDKTLALPQRKFREIVFQMIYSQDFSSTVDPKAAASLLDQLKVTKKSLRLALEKVTTLFTHLEKIDHLISKFSEDYDFKRIARIERNILRLAVFELLYDESVPPKVAMAEAIRLSRKFGTPEGGAFVNAVLDAIHKNKESGEWISESASSKESS